MFAADPLAITRGLALTEVGLAQAGLSREERLPLWRASLNAMAAQGHAPGLGGWLIPGAQLWVESVREGPVLCELGWPEMPAGPAMMRWPIRRFGAMGWDLDGAPGRRTGGLGCSGPPAWSSGIGAWTSGGWATRSQRTSPGSGSATPGSRCPGSRRSRAGWAGASAPTTRR